MGYGTQKSKLIKALLEAFPENADVEALGEMLGANADDYAARNARRAQLVTGLLRWAESQGRERDLLDEAIVLNDSNAELNAVVTSIVAYLESVAPWYVSPDPIATCIVRGDQAFVDRVELRQALQRLTTKQGARTLIVKGDPASGRSYTLQLIVFLADGEPDWTVIDIDLTESGADLGPDGLVRRIALQLGLDADTIPPQQEQAPRWNAELRDWVVGKVNQDDRTCWIVIDGIDQVRPRDETMDLIWKLVDAAGKGTKLRLVLLACSEPVTDQLEAFTIREEIDHIDRGMVEAFFTLFLTHKNVPATPQLVKEATDAVMGGVPDAGPDRLRTLERQAAKVAKRIATGV